MTLATLFLCGKEDLITSFFSISSPPFCDGSLPLHFGSPGCPNFGLCKRDRELFTYFQWQIYTPFLTRIASKKDVKIYPDEVSLPWRQKERITQEEAAEVPFVEKIEIYPGNHNLHSHQWLVRQCLGIAEALVAIHGLAERNCERTKSLLHADIKAENILCFRTPESEERGVILKLADFGETEWLGPEVTLKPKGVAHVKTYRPPEKDFGKNITLSYDVWCLGCLFLEFVTWYTRGQEGIEWFSKMRAEEVDNSAVTAQPTHLVEDIFFKRTKQKPGASFYRRLKIGYSRTMKVRHGETATTLRSLWVSSKVEIVPELKDGVISHLRSLQSDAKCTDELRKLLSFVEERMLVVKPEGRAGSPEPCGILSPPPLAQPKKIKNQLYVNTSCDILPTGVSFRGAIRRIFPPIDCSNQY
ncbi:hypothetical protein KVR01_011969 [Diaporthe batatas]|uniref:uncharacterized protein n=1 Tax=Diaporthe batatas TaxID=748121 RepID=UPI001D040964|nr:uncharacterized protein KVR01_011969 [Diaporthe batatas]KAG8158208.1 hypothetical protein KVR01_011969 [Diaporthe batatas]